MAAWLTLAWVSSLFLALAAAFWFRSKNVFLWRPVEPPQVLWLSSIVLGLSSLTLERARRALEAKRWFAYRRRVLLTLYLALGFAAGQGAALLDLMGRGYDLRADPHSAAFYLFTVAHALHLAGGVAALNYLLLRRGRDPARLSERLSAVAIYWHFIGIVWAGLFALLLAW
jgi:cytochrome c oxidase subunit 3